MTVNAFHFSFVSVTLLVSLLLLLAARLITRYRRLSHIPGPFLAALTDLWRFYHQNQPHGLRTKLLALHSKHGPLVRYGVNSISISTPSAIPQIYGSRAGFVTADSYKVLVGISNGREVPSLVSTADEAKHGAFRRSIASTFTPAGVAPLESRIDTTIRELHSHLVRLAKQNQPIDLAHWTMLFSMDSAARQAFSESRGYLSSGHDTDGTIALIRARFYHWGRWSSWPSLERLIYRNPISILANPACATLFHHVFNNQTLTPRRPPAILHLRLRRAPEPPRQIRHYRLLMSTISGAGDTTATTLTAIFYYLYTHHPALAALRAELDAHTHTTNGGTYGGAGQFPRHSTLKDLPYLGAVIKEAMRLFSSATWPIERLVPEGDMFVDDIRIPAGTSVGVLPAAIHLDTHVYGADAAYFRPERWLEANKEELRQMEAAHMGFSRGRRACLGKEVALMQMKMVVAMVVGQFELEISDPNNAGLQADFSAAVACMHPLWVRVRLRGSTPQY
ncbi:Pisatin demethylase [Cyphellophora attinorum]|uniref:Pisatin demethylase n=1 Tax=Cyphellophora attinorum TaxID=1664694 RepID=A0A0N1NYK0_9EURO|nr:Pisatin demethylase [Phialophora attinorum]KPI37144.1 Pisatin demethylase [Phialophora attinorum]